MQARRFADFWKGVFFLTASVSLTIGMAMFVFVWQPIWTKGFKDFHTISEAISKLDETAKPVSRIAPSMLNHISEMNTSLGQIENTMLTMEEIRDNMKEIRVSMKNLEELNPNVIRMSHTMEQINQVISGQMGRMNYEVDQMGDKLSPFGMMPFNW